MKSYTKKLAITGVIAALYAVTSLIAFPIASGAIQLRVSEALCLLPLIFPESVIGLFVGCLLSNLLTGCAPFDVIFGSLITLVAGMCTLFTGKLIRGVALKIFIGGLFPVMLNAFLLPLIWVYCYGVLEYLYVVQAVLLVVGQSVAVYAFGTPLFLKIRQVKTKKQ